MHEYKIVTGKMDALHEGVNTALDEGWDLAGPAFTVCSWEIGEDNWEAWLAQPMMKSDEDTHLDGIKSIAHKLADIVTALRTGNNFR